VNMLQDAFRPISAPSSIFLSTCSKTLSRDMEEVPTTKRRGKGQQLPPTKE
jgi:hypothetical protein